jgi:hypothetical protein
MHAYTPARERNATNRPTKNQKWLIAIPDCTEMRLIIFKNAAKVAIKSEK